MYFMVDHKMHESNLFTGIGSKPVSILPLR